MVVAGMNCGRFFGEFGGLNIFFFTWKLQRKVHEKMFLYLSEDDFFNGLILLKGVCVGGDKWQQPIHKSTEESRGRSVEANTKYDRKLI